MSSESKPFIKHGPACPGKGTIPELISSLRSCFQQREWDRVQQILINREEDLKRTIREKLTEAGNLKEEHAFVERKHSELSLVKSQIEKDLSKCNRECYQLREKVTQLSEDKAVFSEKERVFTDREKRYEQSYQKLSEDFAKMEKETDEKIIKLNNVILELKSEKSRVEAEGEMWKKKFQDLEPRILKLEEDTTVLLRDHVMKSREEEEGLELKETLGYRGSINDFHVNNSGNMNPLHPHKQSGFHCHEKAQTSQGALSPVNDSNVSQEAGTGGSKSLGVIEINDSDDECPTASKSTYMADTSNACSSKENLNDKEINRIPKRKQASSCFTAGDYDDEVKGKHKTKKSQDLICGPQSPVCSIAKPNSCSDCDVEAVNLANHGPVSSEHNKKIPSRSSEDGSCSESDEDISDEAMKNFIASQKNRVSRGWAFQADMLQEFRKDPTLCMNAVCALYRQQTSTEKAVRSPLLLPHRGFNQSDTLWGTKLGEFLINGDPQKRLKRSVSELQEYGHDAVYKCRLLATNHVQQLLEIYQRKEDPFFP